MPHVGGLVRFQITTGGGYRTKLGQATRMEFIGEFRFARLDVSNVCEFLNELRGFNEFSQATLLDFF